MKKIPSIEAIREKYQRGNVFADSCPSREILNHVTSRWGVLVLIALIDGERHRFSELRKKIVGISEKMLAQTLQTLERDGFVLRIAYPVVPPHVEYQLTANGHTVAQKVILLAEWIEENIFDIQTVQYHYDDQKKEISSE